VCTRRVEVSGLVEVLGARGSSKFVAPTRLCVHWALRGSGLVEILWALGSSRFLASSRLCVQWARRVFRPRRGSVCTGLVEVFWLRRGVWGALVSSGFRTAARFCVLWARRGIWPPRGSMWVHWAASQTGFGTPGLGCQNEENLAIDNMI